MRLVQNGIAPPARFDVFHLQECYRRRYLDLSLPQRPFKFEEEFFVIVGVIIWLDMNWDRGSN